MAPHLSKKNRLGLREAIKTLKDKLPTEIDVKVKTVANLEYLGCTEVKGKGKRKYYLITLLRTNYEMMVQVLTHEYAHCLEKMTDDNDWHNNEWAKCYSKAYNVIYSA